MIEKIRIQNFKSIADVTVELSPVTVLIGPSGVGKSNFLRAIRFLRNYLLNPGRAEQLEGGWDFVFPFGTRKALSIDVCFRIPGYDALFRYEVHWIPAANALQLIPGIERLTLGSDLIFEHTHGKWEKWPDAKPKPAHEAKLYLGLFPTISEAVLAFTALTSGIGWHDFPADVFRYATKENGSAIDKGLGDSAGNYLEVLRDLTQDLHSQHARRKILARLRQINKSVASVELDSILNPRGVVVAHEVGDIPIGLTLSQESDGFRRYFAHLLALYQTHPKQLLMFEEPENGIYPGALRNLTEEFSNAKHDGRGQVLLTTQSPDLLDGFAPESIRVVGVNNKQETQIAPLSQDQISDVRNQLLEPGELLNVTTPRIN